METSDFYRVYRSQKGSVKFRRFSSFGTVYIAARNEEMGKIIWVFLIYSHETNKKLLKEILFFLGIVFLTLFFKGG